MFRIFQGATACFSCSLPIKINSLAFNITNFFFKRSLTLASRSKFRHTYFETLFLTILMSLVLYYFCQKEERAKPGTSPVKRCFLSPPRNKVTYLSRDLNICLFFCYFSGPRLSVSQSPKGRKLTGLTFFPPHYVGL